MPPAPAAVDELELELELVLASVLAVVLALVDVDAVFDALLPPSPTALFVLLVLAFVVFCVTLLFLHAIAATSEMAMKVWWKAILLTWRTGFLHRRRAEQLYCERENTAIDWTGRCILSFDPKT